MHTSTLRFNYEESSSKIYNIKIQYFFPSAKKKKIDRKDEE